MFGGMHSAFDYDDTDSKEDQSGLQPQPTHVRQTVDRIFFRGRHVPNEADMQRHHHGDTGIPDPPPDEPCYFERQQMAQDPSQTSQLLGSKYRLQPTQSPENIAEHGRDPRIDVSALAPEVAFNVLQTAEDTSNLMASRATSVHSQSSEMIPQPVYAT